MVSRLKISLVIQLILSASFWRETQVFDRISARWCLDDVHFMNKVKGRTNFFFSGDAVSRETRLRYQAAAHTTELGFVAAKRNENSVFCIIIILQPLFRGRFISLLRVCETLASVHQDHSRLKPQILNYWEYFLKLDIVLSEKNS